MLVFVLAGKVVATIINAPGSMHNYEISEWEGLYDKSKKIYINAGRNIAVDSAFDKSRYRFLLKSSKAKLKNIAQKT